MAARNLKIEPKIVLVFLRDDLMGEKYLEKFQRSEVEVACVDYFGKLGIRDIGLIYVVHQPDYIYVVDTCACLVNVNVSKSQCDIFATILLLLNSNFV